MDLSAILAISRLELKRRRKSASPKAIIAISITLTIFIAAFILLSINGLQQHHTFYKVGPVAGDLEAYLEADGSPFGIEADADHVFERTREGYRYASRRSLEGLASRSALITHVKDVNDYLLDTLEIAPRHLLLINVTSVFREDIINESDLERPGVTSGDINNPLDTIVDNAQDGSESQTRDDSQDGIVSTPAVSDQTSGTTEGGDQSTVPSPTQERGVGEDITSENPLDVRSNAAEIIAQGDTITEPRNLMDVAEHEDLQPISDISTLTYLADLLMVIQIIIVFNIVSALLGSSVFEEKINQRSSLLFTADVKRYEFFLGKSIPYFLIAMVLSLGLLFWQHPHMAGEWVSYVIVAVVASLYFAVSVINGLIARSHKEFSFLNVFTISVLSLYMLIPSFIANVSTLGYASLFTPLIFAIQGEPVNMALVFFVVPIYAAVGILTFYLASRTWEYEELYSFMSPVKHILSMIAASLQSWWTYLLFGAFVVPFGWLLQLIIIAILLAMQIPLEAPLFFLAAAYIEEFLRNMGVYAKPPDRPLLISLLTGIGFTLAEKAALFITIAPFLEGYQVLLIGGLIVPILLHSSLTYLFIQLRKQIPLKYGAICLITGLIHGIINFAIVSALGVLAL